nr:hypothetical protein [Nevskia sp.]
MFVGDRQQPLGQCGCRLLKQESSERRSCRWRQFDRTIGIRRFASEGCLPAQCSSHDVFAGFAILTEGTIAGTAPGIRSPLRSVVAQFDAIRLAAQHHGAGRRRVEALQLGMAIPETGFAALPVGGTRKIVQCRQIKAGHDCGFA